MPLSRRHKKTKRIKKRFNKKLQKTKRLNKRGGREVDLLPTIPEENEEINKPLSPVYDYGAEAEEEEEEELRDNEAINIFIHCDVILNLDENNNKEKKKNIEQIELFLNQMEYMRKKENMMVYVQIYDKVSKNYNGITFMTIPHIRDKLYQPKPSMILTEEDEKNAAIQDIEIMIEFFKRYPFNDFDSFKRSDRYNRVDPLNSSNSSKNSIFITDNEIIHSEIQKYVDSDETKLSGLKVFQATKNNYIKNIIMIINYLQGKYKNNTEKEKYLKGCLEHWTGLLQRSKNGGKRRNSTSKRKYK